MSMRLAPTARAALNISNQLATFQRHKKVGVTEALFGVIKVLADRTQDNRGRPPAIDFAWIYSSLYQSLNCPSYNETLGTCERSPYLQFLIRSSYDRAFKTGRGIIFPEDLLLQILTKGRRSLNVHLLKQAGVKDSLEALLISHCSNFWHPSRKPGYPHRRKHGGNRKKASDDKRRNRKPTCA